MATDGKRKTIYLNPPLQELYNKTRGKGFSRRLGDVLNRYEIIRECTSLPKLTAEQWAMLGQALIDAKIDKRKVLGLHLDMLDVEGEEAQKVQLQHVIEKMSVTERLMLIEEFDEKFSGLTGQAEDKDE